MNKIWIDGDACPKPVKDILCRAAIRNNRELIFVANKLLKIPVSPGIKMVTVAGGPDVADDYIHQHVCEGDLVITADVPLAAAVIEKKAFVLNHRGELYDAANIRHILSIRNFMTEMRTGGVETGGPRAYNRKDRENFANALQRFLQHPTAGV